MVLGAELRRRTAVRGASWKGGRHDGEARGASGRRGQCRGQENSINAWPVRRGFAVGTEEIIFGKCLASCGPLRCLALAASSWAQH
jgi:hypothetical protein